MFAGEVQHQLDTKLRMRMPLIFKSGFNKVYAFRPIRDGVLAIYPADKLEERFSFMASASVFDEQLQDDIAEYMSDFTIVEEDNQGRIMIPKHLRSLAGLEKDIVVYGAADHVNVTSASNRQKDKERAKTDRQAMMKRLDEAFGKTR